MRFALCILYILNPCVLQHRDSADSRNSQNSDLNPAQEEDVLLNYDHVLSLIRFTFHILNEIIFFRTATGTVTVTIPNARNAVRTTPKFTISVRTRRRYMDASEL